MIVKAADGIPETSARNGVCCIPRWSFEFSCFSNLINWEINKMAGKGKKR